MSDEIYIEIRSIVVKSLRVRYPWYTKANNTKNRMNFLRRTLPSALGRSSAAAGLGKQQQVRKLHKNPFLVSFFFEQFEFEQTRPDESKQNKTKQEEWNGMREDTHKTFEITK